MKSLRILILLVILWSIWSTSAIAQETDISPLIVNTQLSPLLAANEDVCRIAFTSDERFVVFQVTGFSDSAFVECDDNGDLYRMAVGGGELLQLNVVAEGEPALFVQRFIISPDNSRIIFQGTTDEESNLYNLYSVSIDGGVLTQLNSPQIDNASVFNFLVTPDNQRVIYMGIQDVESVSELYQVSIDGGTITKLSPPATNPRKGVFVIDITPDGSRVLYSARQNLPTVTELYSVPVDGASTAQRISGPMVAGGGLSSQFQITSDSNTVIYMARQENARITELYRAPIRGGITTKLNHALDQFEDVERFYLTPDQVTVLYEVERDRVSFRPTTLFGVPLAGGIPVVLSPPTDDEASVGAPQNFLVSEVQISSDSTTVVYALTERLGSGSADELTFLSSIVAASIAGGSPLTLTPAEEESTSRYARLSITSGDENIVYHRSFGTNTGEVLSIPVAGGQPIRLNAPLAQGERVVSALTLSADGTAMVYETATNRFGGGDIPALYRVDIDSGQVLRLTPPFSERGLIGSTTISQNGERIFYTFKQGTGNEPSRELFTSHDVPRIALLNTDAIVLENAPPTSTLELIRTGIVDAPASIRVQLTGESATGGASPAPEVDFLDSALTVNFATGEQRADIHIPIFADNIAEPPETLQVQLFEPVGAFLNGNDRAVVTIKEPDANPLLADATRTIPENSPIGTSILPALAVRDDNVGETFTWSITGGNDQNIFTITSNGTIKIAKAIFINHEVNPQFQLKVTVQDSAGLTDSALVTIDVTDENDAPILGNASFVVTENSPQGTIIGQINPRDEDADDEVQLSIDSDVFGIDNHNQIVVADSSALDFETNPRFIVNVTATDSARASDTGQATILVRDVQEPDPNEVRIGRIFPGSITAGAKAFTLIVNSTNLPRGARVFWNGKERPTRQRSQSTLAASISAADVAKASIATITLKDKGNNQLSVNTVRFPIVERKVGLNEVKIDGNQSASFVGQPTQITLEWTHTTLAWRGMDVMDIRLANDERVALWIRYQESKADDGSDTSTLTLLDEAGFPVGSAKFGNDMVLETDYATFDLGQASFAGSGPEGSTVSVTLPVTFKQAAAGQTYNIELFAVDDEEEVQGPDIAGSIDIIDPVTYLPIFVK